MSIENVYMKLQNTIIECEQGAIEAESQKHWLKGMADMAKLALRVLSEEGVVPADPTDRDIIPFNGGNLSA